MDQSKKKVFAPELRFFIQCKQAISNQEYRNALEILKEGLSGLIENAEQISDANLIMYFYALVDELESALKDAYGDAWEKQAQAPEAPQGAVEIICSFCKKTRAEVSKIIAGPNVYICDECVEICGKIIAESTADLD